MRGKSSVIREIEYFEDERVLEITFLSKSRFVYYFVEPETFKDFANADSKGRFYNERIKGFYDSSKSL